MPSSTDSLTLKCGQWSMTSKIAAVVTNGIVIWFRISRSAIIKFRRMARQIITVSGEFEASLRPRGDLRIQVYAEKWGTAPDSLCRNP